MWWNTDLTEIDFLWSLCCKWSTLRLLLAYTLCKKCLFFEITLLLGLTKNGKNVSVTSKMQMITKIISRFVFLYTGTRGHCISSSHFVTFLDLESSSKFSKIPFSQQSYSTIRLKFGIEVVQLVGIRCRKQF